MSRANSALSWFRFLREGEEWYLNPLLPVGSHSSRFNESLGRAINLASLAALRGMNVKTLAVYLPVLIWRQRNLVLHRLAVIFDLQVWIVDAVELPEHLHKVGLTVNQSIDGQPGSFPEGS